MGCRGHATRSATLNILLVYPQFPPTFWSFEHALRIVRKKSVAPPLGLLTVAAMLPTDWGTRLVDLNVRDLTADDLAWADYVFISGMAVQREAAHRLIDRLKVAGKTVIAGGPLFTGEYAIFTKVDHFVLNEAELTIESFLADLRAGTLKRVYRSRQFADMSRSPVPAWELVDLSHYACACVQYSRGCPFDCEFCNVTSMLGRTPRLKSPQQIVAELDAIHATGWRGSVFFVDDNLIGNRKAARTELMPALIEWQARKGPMPFFTQASINLADDPRLMHDMVQAGFDAVFVGIETPDADVLADCGKKQNTKRDLVEDVKRLQRAGMEVQAGFIVGFDGDTETTFDRQIEFVQRSGIATAMVGMLHAPPGTKLARRMSLEGRMLGPSSGDNADGSTNFVPKMGLEALRSGYQRLLSELFAPGPYYRRLKTFLREFRRPRGPLPITREKVRAVLRAAWHIGIVGRERLQFWQLVIWTTLFHPELFSDAIRLAVCGNHYRRISEALPGRPPPAPVWPPLSEHSDATMSLNAAAS